MQQLDAWMNESVIYPLTFGDPDDMPGSRTGEQIIRAARMAIREKVLESYRNGLAAGNRPAKKKADR